MAQGSNNVLKPRLRPMYNALNNNNTANRQQNVHTLEKGMGKLNIHGTHSTKEGEKQHRRRQRERARKSPGAVASTGKRSSEAGTVGGVKAGGAACKAAAASNAAGQSAKSSEGVRSKERKKSRNKKHDSIIPDVIIEKRKSSSAAEGVKCVKYHKGKYLGKGGFARCYTMVREGDGLVYAGKVVSKTSLKKEKAKQKLLAEIRIHKNLSHKHIVRFEHFFEDKHNVYLLLELCSNHSLMELVKRRKRLTEPEARYWLLQLIDALRYLHSSNVIHRDLKLGNLFLNAELDIKVGDLGLSAKLLHSSERKKTICGTPNYIAPEIIEGRSHSFEVDVWSLGVIMYTMLVGRPPFETRDVKSTYKKIKAGSYSFPSDLQISDDARTLITWILQISPDRRPTLEGIASHAFFTREGAYVPSQMPLSALHSEPSFSKKWAHGKKKQQRSPSMQYHHRQQSAQRSKKGIKKRPGTAGSIRSSTSSAAVQKHPRPATSSGMTARERERLPLGSRYPHRSAQTGSAAVTTTAASSAPRAPSAPSAAAPPLPPAASNKEASGRSGPETSDARSRSMPSSAAVPMMSTLKNMHQALKHVFESKPGGDGSGRTAGKTAAASGSLENAQSSAARGPTPLKDGNGPETWVTRWVDYTSKYGLGYMLSNGSIGIYFNDSTKIVLSSDGNTFEYMERSSRSRSGSHHAAEVARQKHTLKEYPEALKKKVTLLNSFQGYLQNQESKRKDPANDYELESRARGSGASSMTFVKKWIRTRHAILFRMSNRTVQIRFFDGTEIILTSHGNVVTYVGKQKKQTDPKQQASFSLTDVMSSNRNDITKRLKYTKDILHQLLTGVTKK